MGVSGACTGEACGRNKKWCHVGVVINTIGSYGGSYYVTPLVDTMFAYHKPGNGA